MTHRADVVGGLLAIVGSLAAVTFSIQLWRAHLHSPLAYGSDALASQMIVKNLISGGWVWTNNSLGLHVDFSSTTTGSPPMIFTSRSR